MLDKRFNLENEKEMQKLWEEKEAYKFKGVDERPVYSVDTPPPTVSGKLHVGHIFSFTQSEMLVRYHRLKGENVYYPFGFDDNGLPTERLVEREEGIFAKDLPRSEFIEKCTVTKDKYIKEFQDLFKRLGISADWNLGYDTINELSRKVSQRSFIDLVKKGKAYRKEMPVLWCPCCQTSIAQAELENKDVKSYFNYINFSVDNKDLEIATTRPEFLGGCVAIFVNPNDERYKDLIGKTAIVPLYNNQVPIIADEKVAIDKGTGVVMCCTFGDQTDMEWQKEYNLPIKKVMQADGTINPEVAIVGGMKTLDARMKIVEELQKQSLLVKSEKIEHSVSTHERCGNEIEIINSPQWYIDILSIKDELIKAADEINWHPESMKTRYLDWVNNLKWDWCISRQRYFGVPFPVWYCKECGEPIFASKEQLPVNPLTDTPLAEKCSKCGCKEFIPESDVMDTWATSSVTPLINMKYGEKDNYEAILKPMSLRSNASEIIRTWDFYTIVKSYYHFGIRPWDNVMISGFVMANKGEKISKSKGNSKVEPLDLIKQYSADVVRYWAASGRLGTDITYSEETLLRGKKLVNKIWNVSKLIQMHLQDYQDKDFDDFEYVDKWILGNFIKMEKEYIKYLDNYEIGLALNILEKFFWNFCDNYIEIVKHRLYRPEEFGEKARYSGQKTVYMLLYKLLQDFSIFFPFITEEIYQDIYHDMKSIHITEIKPLNYSFDNEMFNGDLMCEIISAVRGEKSSNNLSLKTTVKELDIDCSAGIKDAIKQSEKDFKATLFIEKLILNDIEKDYKINKVVLDTENS